MPSGGREPAPRVELSTPRPDVLPAPGPAPGGSAPVGSAPGRPAGGGPAGGGPAPARWAGGHPPSRPAAEIFVEGVRAVVRRLLALVRRMPPRLRLVAAAALVLLLVGTPLTLWLVQRVAFSPARPVDAVVEAFAAGDAHRAARLVGCTSRLCGTAALAEGYRPPADLSTGAVVTSGDTAYVELRWTVDGRPGRSTVTLRRDGGLLWRDWSIASGFTGTIDVVTPTVKSARVGGSTLPTVAQPRPAGRRGGTEALIGTYTVATLPDDPLFTAEPVTVSVAGDQVVELAVTVRPAVVEAVAAQVRARLDRCAATAEFAPRGCPFAYQKVLYRPADPVWRIDTYPTFEVRLSDRPAVTGGPLAVRTTTPGRATVSYTSGGVPQTAPVEFEVRGSVSVRDGTVTWTG